MTSWNGASPHWALGSLVDCLEQIPTLRDPGGRRLCLELVADRLGSPLLVEEFPVTRTHLIAIVRACHRQHSSGLTVLVDVLDQLEPGSAPVRRARAAVEDLAALDVVADTDRQELLTLLAGSAGARLAEFVRAAAGPTVELPGEHHKPGEALATLERLNARPDGVPPLLLFVEYLAASLDDHRAEQLRAWNDRQAVRMGVAEQVSALRLERAPEPAGDVVAYLVIRLEEDLLEPDTLTAVHWRQHDASGWYPRRGEPFTGDLDAVRAHVAGLVAEAESGWATHASAIRVEFLLPYALLNLPVDQWDLEAGSGLPRPLGLHYQVVVRSLDRARSVRWHREWRRRWTVLKQQRSAGVVAADAWLWSAGGKPRHLPALDAKLAMQADSVSLVLHAVPDGTETGEVMVGVRAGVPVMVWHRHDSVRKAFETELKAIAGELPDLAECLRRLRGRAKQAARPDSHVGSRISLLWDDPDRPVEPQDPPVAPNEEVPAP